MKAYQIKAKLEKQAITIDKIKALVTEQHNNHQEFIVSTFARIEFLEGERDRYRELVERLAAGKFESGDHAQELARETLQKERITDERSKA